MISSDDVERIVVEVTTGKSPATADTPEQAEFRQKIESEVAEIIAKGGIVDIPHEIPGGDEL